MGRPRRPSPPPPPPPPPKPAPVKVMTPTKSEVDQSGDAYAVRTKEEEDHKLYLLDQREYKTIKTLH